MHRFTSELLSWYEKNARDLPWRRTKDAYRIWLSEVILQQTQVIQGTDYYLRFLERFPDVFALARATDDEVMQLWQGLGYYSRARNLHKAAKIIAEKGAFPMEYAEIRALPGVGDYTAAAISSFAYDLPYAAIDGNAYRVLSRYFALAEAIDMPAGRRRFADLARELLPSSAAANFNSGMMDLGATVCTPKNPRCETCPLVASCMAYAEGCVCGYPVKSKTIVRRTRYFVYVLLRSNTHCLLFKRGAGDIWQGLYEPLLLEFSERPSELEIFSHPLLEGKFPEAKWRRLVEKYKHQLTHQQIYMSAYEMTVSRLGAESAPGAICCSLDEKEDYPHSRLVEVIWEHI